MTESTAPMPPSPADGRRRRGLFWPLVLIGVGLVALLANYGFISGLSVVSILALWPVLLILLGIDIAFARRWPVPTLAAEVAIIAGALLLAVTEPNVLGLTAFNFGSSSSCRDPQSSLSVPRGSLQGYTLSINGGAARYHVTGGASGAVEATADYDELCLTVRDSGGSRGDIRLNQGGTRIGGSNDIDVKLANDLPVSLIVNAGAGEFDLDLHDVSTTLAMLNIGASNTTIVLPHPSADVLIHITGGASNVTVRIPSDVEARITVTGGLVSSNTTNPRATKSGSVIETAGFATAKDRVTVTVTGGATSVSVQ